MQTPSAKRAKVSEATDDDKANDDHDSAINSLSEEEEDYYDDEAPRHVMLYNCDSCNVILRGTRYSCEDCEFDLCVSCFETKPELHIPKAEACVGMKAYEVPDVLSSIQSALLGDPNALGDDSGGGLASMSEKEDRPTRPHLLRNKEPAAEGNHKINGHRAGNSNEDVDGADSIHEPHMRQIPQIDDSSIPTGSPFVVVNGILYKAVAALSELRRGARRAPPGPTLPSPPD